MQAEEILPNERAFHCAAVYGNKMIITIKVYNRTKQRKLQARRSQPLSSHPELKLLQCSFSRRRPRRKYTAKAVRTFLAFSLARIRPAQ